MSELANATVEELAKTHPAPPGDMRDAQWTLAQILVDAIDPEAVCASAKENHKAYVPHWKAALARKPRGFVPQLQLWFKSGEYRVSPPPLEASVNGDDYLHRRLREAEEREAKQRGGQ